jgi:predicted RNA-binding protein with PIN domain
VVVFDALMSGLPTHKEDFAGVDVIFSGETCADAWIEKEVVALREDGCPKVWVVTSDVCQQQAAHGAVLGHHIDVINSLCSYLVFDFGD